MENQFSNLGVQENIVNSIEKMGFLAPTEVQEKVIPKILKGEDLIVLSKTGSGKTGAFGIPIIQKVDPEAKNPQALILTPTRELAVQVDSDLKLMSKQVKCSTAAVYGQHNMNVEIQALQKGVSILTGTPGRVHDHIRQGNFKTSGIRYLVLDEADRMLDMGFIDQVVRIIKALPKDRVTLLFSATMPPEIQNICKTHMKNPEAVEIASETKTVDAIEQVYYRVVVNEKRKQLDRVLKVEQPETCMIFCNTRATVDRVQKFLMEKGYTADSLHGANSQSSRLRTINNFKKGCYQILVATDVAARGIHVEDLSLVINYDVPLEKDSYVHRIGRTGRAGQMGKAISLVTSDEIMSLYEIEEHVGALIEEIELPTDEALREAIEKAAQKPKKQRPAPIGGPTVKKQESGKSGSPKTAGKPRTDFKPKTEGKLKEDNKPKTDAKPKTDIKTSQPSRNQPQKSAFEKPIKEKDKLEKPVHRNIEEQAVKNRVIVERVVPETVKEIHTPAVETAKMGILQKVKSWLNRKK